MGKSRKTGKASADLLSPGFLRFVAVTVCLAAALKDASAQDSLIVRAVHIEGVSASEASELQPVFASALGMPYRPGVMAPGLDQTVHLLGEEGYVFAAVDSVDVDIAPDASGADVKIFVSKGPQATISGIAFHGNRQLSSPRLQRVLGISAGSIFRSSEVQQGIRRILDEYDQAGYPLAKVSVRNLHPTMAGDTASVALELAVEEGPLATLREVRVEGNRLTKTDVILRQAGVEEGEVYRSFLGPEIVHRLQRLDLFSSISSPELYLREGGGFGLLLRVADGEPNRFDGLAGYVPASGGGSSGYVTGTIDIQLRNLFGTARRFAVHWQRLDRLTQEVGLRYREPWVASLPVDAEVRFDQRKQDSTYLQRSYRLEATTNVSDRFSVSVSLSTWNVYPTENGTLRVPEARALTAGIAGVFDARDDPVTPRSGVRYATSVESGSRKLSGPPAPAGGQKQSTTTITMDVEYYVGVLRNQVLALSGHLREIRSSSLNLSDLFRLGGARTLRGYREDQFEGSRVVWASLEYRVPTSDRSFAYAFLDGGYIRTPSVPAAGLESANLARFGYGVGIRLDTSLGLIGLSLALGKGDTFSTAKLHLRLENAF